MAYNKNILPDTEIETTEAQTETTSAAESDEERRARILRTLEALARMRRGEDEDSDEEDEDDLDEEEDEENDDDFDEDEEEDDDTDEEEDEDNDEDDDTDEEDEDDRPKAARRSEKPGSRVLVESDFPSVKAYCSAVWKLIKAVTKANGYDTDHCRNLREGVTVLLSDASTHGIDCDLHILQDADLRNLRIDLIINPKSKHPNRAPLVDYFCAERSFPLRYGGILYDHSDGEKRIEYSTSFAGAFSEAAFYKYLRALKLTLRAYVDEYAAITDNPLTPELKKNNRKIFAQTASNLPDKVKTNAQQAKLEAVLAALGCQKPTSTIRKIAVYLVGHAE